MAVLQIPERHKKGFGHLISLDNELRNKLIKELNSLPIGLSLEEITKKLSQKLNLKKSELFQIIRTFFSLISNQEESRVDLNIFVDDIIEALKEDEKLEPDIALKSQLTEILSSRGLFYYTSKATTLVNEREKLLVNTRIVTDVRPVFNEEKDCKIENLLVIHNLKIEYHEGSEHKELYFALDGSDLKRLKEHIQRAEEKEKAIREQFKSINIPFLDIK